MNGDAVPPTGSANEAESYNLSLLDLVKHATNTIIQTLSRHDRLALISFSDEAKIVFDLTVMNDIGKR